MRASADLCALLAQALLDQKSAGEVGVRGYGSFKTGMPNLISRFLEAGESTILPAREVQVSTESPKGESSVYLVGAGQPNLWRARFRAPSYYRLSSVNYLSRSQAVADLVTVLGTVDIVFGEIDR